MTSVIRLVINYSIVCYTPFVDRFPATFRLSWKGVNFACTLSTCS